MNLRLPLFAAVLATASLPAAAQAAFNAPRLDSLLTELATKHLLMGSLALSHDGQVVYSRAFGEAQVQPARPATPATRYRIGSISKVFTAVLIFQLLEEKKLTLDTPLRTFFPSLPNADRITIDQLLSHRSGLHNFTDDAAYRGYMTQPQTPGSLLAMFATAKPDFEPGAQYQYSNTNYVLLGYIVEKLTGQPYAQALQKRIVARAGLASTSYGGRIDPTRQQALSYGLDGTTWQLAPETDMSIPGGAGSLVATPTDLNRFLAALFGGKLVSAASLASMQQIRDGYGRGLLQVPFGAKSGYGHTGGIDNFRSAAYYFPADKVAVALCTNGGSYSPNDVVVAALSLYYGRPYRLPDLRPSTYQPAPAELDRYAGTYASPTLPLKVTLTRVGNALQSQATGQGAFTLEPVAQGKFRFRPAGIEVEFDPAQPTFTLRQGGGTFVFTKQ